jgi:hypothetical protein
VVHLYGLTRNKAEFYISLFSISKKKKTSNKSENPKSIRIYPSQENNKMIRPEKQTTGQKEQKNQNQSCPVTQYSSYTCKVVPHSESD